MNYLGVSGYKILDLEDGKLTNTKNEVYDCVNEEIGKLNPDFVVTYEPSGVYGHPDHILVSEVVTELSKSVPFGLIYSTVGRNYIQSQSALKMSGNAKRVKPVEPTFQLVLTFDEYMEKLKALNLYKTQFSIRQEPFHKIYYAVKMRSEYYFFNKDL